MMDTTQEELNGRDAQEKGQVVMMLRGPTPLLGRSPSRLPHVLTSPEALQILLLRGFFEGSIRECD